jgi:hypothetical protein
LFLCYFFTKKKILGATYIASAVSSAGLPVTITSTTTSTCTIAGNGVVSFVGAGSCSLAVNQAGTANVFPGTQVLMTFTVFRGLQTVTFSSSIPTAIVSGATYNAAASSSSGLGVTFSIDPASASICTVAGSVVSFIGSGECRLLGNQGGNANFNPATPAVQSITVLPGTQSVSFSSTIPVGQVVGGPRYNVTGTSNRGLPVVFSIDLSSASVCTISAGNSVSFIGVGTCLVNLDAPATINYDAATQAVQSINVARGSQSVSFVNSAPTNAYVGGVSFSALATATSGLPVTISIGAGSTGVCRYDYKREYSWGKLTHAHTHTHSATGFSVNFNSNSTCVVIASQAGNASKGFCSFIILFGFFFIKKKKNRFEKITSRLQM